MKSVVIFSCFGLENGKDGVTGQKSGLKMESRFARKAKMMVVGTNIKMPIFIKSSVSRIE